jgi:rare lipoprotein A
MVFNHMPTQNWTRAFQVWIEDIHVHCPPIIAAPIQACLLGRVRGVSRCSALGVVLLFAIHCSSPTKTVRSEASRLPTPGQAREMAVEATPCQESGNATWYGAEREGFRGRRTASGELFDPEAHTCAHRTMPFGTSLLVENARNHLRTIVRVNDRGPFIHGRMLDLSYRAAHDLGFLDQGITRVRIRVIDTLGAPTTEAAERANPYTVQVAALSRKRDLARLTRDLGDRFGRVTFKDGLDHEGQAVERVLVGSFGTAEEAQKAADQLVLHFQGRKVETFVTRRS